MGYKRGPRSSVERGKVGLSAGSVAWLGFEEFEPGM